MAAADMGWNPSVMLVSADSALRNRLRKSLHGMRWQVREAGGGAEALEQMEVQPAEAVLLDHWLPDLEVGEVAAQIGTLCPGIDLLRVDGNPVGNALRSPRRNELLHALREAGPTADAPPQRVIAEHRVAPAAIQRLEELVGNSAPMLELSRLVRLVAPRSATVLIEGETGTGKELIAKALHRLSARAAKPFVVLNCAAIPESLLEAELFGHTRGAFTGAVQSRTGRIETAHGGTLFLDEIGEMPLAPQAKMLRFLENGELQRVGENEMQRVDVRVIAATHQDLLTRSDEGSFRLDLYHRLAVFPLEVPPLRKRIEDIVELAEHFLASLGKSAPRKSLAADALERLREHRWAGNVRELAHVLERAVILAGDAAAIGAEHIRVRHAQRV